MNKSVMKCCICNNENIGEFITINNKKYHLCCIERLQQENQKYKKVIDKANKYINKMFDTGFYNDDYYLGHLKMILEDKEVE